MNDRDHAIAEAMQEAFPDGGSLEYPGSFQFQDAGGAWWATGLNGWHYSTDDNGNTLDLDGVTCEEDLDGWSPKRIAHSWRKAADQNGTDA